MKICISNNTVEFFSSAKTLNETLSIGRVVLTLKIPLLIGLLGFYLQPWKLQFDKRTPAVQPIWIITITISNKSWFKKNDKPSYKDYVANKQSPRVIRQLSRNKFLRRWWWCKKVLFCRCMVMMILVNILSLSIK